MAALGSKPPSILEKMAESCDICTEKFLRTPNRKPVICHLCEHKACSTCCQTYLLGSIQDAHCMNCRRTWSREFMITSFPGTFINQTYKKHREDVLMARQKAILPNRMMKIDRMNRGEELAKTLEILLKKVQDKRNELYEFERKYNARANKVHALRMGLEPGAAGANKDKNELVREFHKSCPSNDCRGFLSSQYKCGLCSIWVCPDCYEIKGMEKDAAHTCKPENIESVKLKKKQCKNCPECSAEIYKEIGCDQMWCTQCQTPFDWKTGAKLVNVRVHNPHYYEYIRRTQGTVPRENDGGNRDAAIACYNHHETFIAIARIGNRTWTNLSMKELVNFGIIEVVRVITHIDEIEIPRHNIVINESTNEDIDIRYLRKQIDEKSWKQMLQNREKQRIKKQDILQILQMVSQAAKDILLSFVNRDILDVRGKPDKNTLQNALTENTWNQLEGIRTLSNESFEKHSELYKCQAPKIQLVNINAKKRLITWDFVLKFNYALVPSETVEH